MRAIIDPDAYPVFNRYVSRPYDFDLNQLFEFGLGRLLDGLAAFEARPKSPAGSRTPTHPA